MPRIRHKTAARLAQVGLLYLLPALLSSCGNSVNLAVFSQIPKAKITVELDSAQSALNGNLDRRRIRFSGTAFGASRTLNLLVRNRGDEIAKGLSIGIFNPHDEKLFEVVKNTCTQQLDYRAGRNTCEISLKFTAPVPHAIADFGDSGIVHPSEIDFTYENGVIEKDAGPRIQTDAYTLEGRSILAPYFIFSENQILVLPSPGASPRYVTEDRVNFESPSSPISSPWPPLTNPNYETQSIPIHVTFNGSLLPQRDCEAFVNDLRGTGDGGISLGVRITGCKQSSQLRTLIDYMSADSGTVANCEDLLAPAQAQQALFFEDQGSRSVSLSASCSEDNGPIPRQRTVSLQFRPSFPSENSVGYLDVRAYTAEISPSGAGGSKLTVKVLAQRPKLNPPVWGGDDHGSLLLADTSAPASPKPTLSWPSRLSRVSDSLPLPNAAYVYKIDLRKIDHSPTPSESFCPQNSNSTTDGSAYSLIFDPQSVQVTADPFVLSTQLSSAKNTSNQAMSWTPHAWYQSCVRAIDSFGNYSSGLMSLLQVSDIAPPNFSPELEVYQNGSANQISLIWNHDHLDSRSDTPYG